MFWEEGCVPQDSKDANVIHNYRNNGNKASCGNIWGMSVLVIAGLSKPHHMPLTGEFCLGESIQIEKK